MAMDIFTGSNIRAEYSLSAGSTVATDLTEIPELNTFTNISMSNAVVDVVEFNSLYNRKLSGSKTVDTISIGVNWVPDCEAHMALEQACNDQARIQIKFSYFENATQDTGYYIVFNGFITNNSISSDKDTVVSKTFSFDTDGAPVDSGLITETDPDDGGEGA
ncbi:hypothetical protein E0U70_20135 [Salmonella enterica subsp. enterica serovar Gloucester]|nr:hypothetical protein [Salmonella enterica subsp. enterica serovar Gloucester]